MHIYTYIMYFMMMNDDSATYVFNLLNISSNWILQHLLFNGHITTCTCSTRVWTLVHIYLVVVAGRLLHRSRFPFKSIPFNLNSFCYSSANRLGHRGDHTPISPLLLPHVLFAMEKIFTNEIDFICLGSLLTLTLVNHWLRTFTFFVQHRSTHATPNPPKRP